MARRPHVVITVVLTCMVAGLLSACGADQPGTASPSTPSPSAGSASPSASAGTSAGSGAVAVYYVGNAGAAGVRLYREFRARPRTDTVIRAAVDAMVNLRPSDLDYRSLWPASAQIHRASKSGAVATVDMEAGPSAPAAMAIQQLVWTVTAADRAVTRVQILIQGRPLTPAPVARAAADDVLAPIWLLTPVHGASVPRTFTLSGDATVFEATVSWEVRQGANVVRRGFVTASKGAPARGSWQASVTVPAAGSYQVVAFESSAKDGTALFADTKTITVR